ncbi:MAG: HAD-IB family hydrolase [Cystobacterineae bacterium]|nr:HAD-IB family hydrolase [Cystobacterineae bacterium]
MSVAFFDLDKTLIARNSAVLWIRRQLREGKEGVLARMGALRVLSWLTRYSLGWGGGGAIPLLEAMEGFAGVSHEEILEQSRRFYEEEVRRLYRPGALEALKQQRQAGCLCILLSSTTQYLGELVAADLGLDGCLANVLETDAEGRLSGRVEGIVCYGRGKLHKAQAKLAELNVAIEDCSFYTDSYADLPVMEAVGSPVAVNADMRLKWWAQLRGHPIVDWGVP